jgi:hypothetical protein
MFWLSSAQWGSVGLGLALLILNALVSGVAMTVYLVWFIRNCRSMAQALLQQVSGNDHHDDAAVELHFHPTMLHKTRFDSYVVWDPDVHGNNALAEWDGDIINHEGTDTQSTGDQELMSVDGWSNSESQEA